MVNNENTYNSLEDIQARREALAKEIDASEDKIADLWQTLFAKEEAPRYETPSKRLQRLMSTGIGIRKTCRIPGLRGLSPGRWRRHVRRYYHRGKLSCHLF